MNGEMHRTVHMIDSDSSPPPHVRGAIVEVRVHAAAVWPARVAPTRDGRAGDVRVKP